MSMGRRLGAAASDGSHIMLETLEDRRLLSATIHGDVYQDSNGNGAEDAGEQYLAAVKVYVDANNNGALDAGETVAASDNKGVFNFTNLAAGTYRLREVVPANYTLTEPAAGFLDVTVADGQAGDTDFGNHPDVPMAIIRGSIFNDANGDKLQQIGEPYQSGWTTYIDANNNSSLDAGETTATTDTTGYFAFQYLSPGTYRIREVVQSGWTQTRPVNPPYYDVSVVGGQTVFDRIFGNKQNPPPPPPNTASIAGSVFNDANGNGVKDLGESALSGWTVFLDANNNGNLDAGESSKTSDASGAYSFTSLAAGTYHVREIVQSGFTRTAPASGVYDLTLVAGQSVSDRNFGNKANPPPPPPPSTASIHGDVYQDSNVNGAEDAGETYLAGVQVYIDANNNGALDAGESAATSNNFGVFTISNLAAGTYRLREVAPAGYTITEPNAGFVDVTLATGQAGDQDFGNHPNAPLGIIRGTVFNDNNGDGLQQSNDPYLSGWTTYLDTNLNGQLDVGEKTAVTDSTGYFAFQYLAPGTYRVREVVQNGWTQTRPTNPPHYDVTIAGGQTVVDRMFGNTQSAPPPPPGTATIVGNVFNDLNGNGIKEAGDGNLANVTMYIDANANNALDAGEKTTSTDASGNYTFTNLAAGTYRVRQVPPAGMRVDNPGSGFRSVTLQSGSIVAADFADTSKALLNGIVYNDLNGDGVIQQPTETGIGGRTLYLDLNMDDVFDAGEPSTTSAASGYYEFIVDPGTYRVREIVPANSGWRFTTPSAFVLTLGSGQSNGRLFGNTQNILLSGTVFNDANGDGFRAGNEAGLSGWRVFIDSNNNGVWDSGEKSVLSDANGRWVFTDLAAGTYVVRIVPTSGWTTTTPVSGAFTFTLASGQTATDKLFGEKATT